MKNAKTGGSVDDIELNDDEQPPLNIKSRYAAAIPENDDIETTDSASDSESADIDFYFVEDGHDNLLDDH